MRALFHSIKRKTTRFMSHATSVTRAIYGYDTSTGENTKEVRDVELWISGENLRLRLQRPGCEGDVDIMCEWQPDKGGWAVYLWGEEDGNDPDMKILIPDGAEPVVRYATFNRFVIKDQSI